MPYKDSEVAKAKARGYYQRPEAKEKKRVREQTPEYKAKQTAYHQRPEIKEKKRAYNQTPEVKARKKARRQTQEAKAKAKAYHQTPEAKKKAWAGRQTPEAKEKKRAYNQSPEAKEKAWARRQTAEFRTYQRAYDQSPKAKARAKARRETREAKEKKRAGSHTPEYRQKARDRRRNDPSFRILSSLRARIPRALKGKGKSASTMKLLGCTVDELWTHLEAQFTKGMTRENYGPYWHVDHIRPCCTFDPSDPNEQWKCFHWTNLQPLRAEENRAKGGAWDGQLNLPIHAAYKAPRQV